MGFVNGDGAPWFWTKSREMIIVVRVVWNQDISVKGVIVERGGRTFSNAALSAEKCRTG